MLNTFIRDSDQDMKDQLITLAAGMKLGRMAKRLVKKTRFLKDLDKWSKRPQPTEKNLIRINLRSCT